MEAEYDFGKRILSEAFPILYRLAVQKGVRVGVVVNVWDNRNPIFARSLNDWKLKEVQRFLCLLNNKTLKPEVKDNLYWIFVHC